MSSLFMLYFSYSDSLYSINNLLRGYSSFSNVKIGFGVKLNKII